tara:strand:+ start:406 stop:1773 length:1368 start_codon:yes stop_codon:yes gene_type:complete
MADSSIIRIKDFKKSSPNKYERYAQTILDGQVTLFRRADGGSAWWYRFWVSSEKRNVRKSTRTTSFTDASHIASEAFYMAKAQLKAGIPVFSKSFEQLFDDVSRDYDRKVERGDITRKSANTLLNAGRFYLLPYFGNRQVTSITQNDLSKYWDFRLGFWKDPKNIARKSEWGIRRVAENPKHETLLYETTVLNKIFEAANDYGQSSSVKHLNTTPPTKKVDSTGSAMTHKQWRQLRNYMRYKWLKEEGLSKTKQHDRNNLYYLCLFLKNTGCRLGDAINLKWRHITRNDDFMIFEVRAKSSAAKSHHRRPIAPIHLWDSLTMWRSISPFNNDDDYVFSKSSGNRFEKPQYLFRTMLDAAENVHNGVSVDFHGRRFTAYDLRHTFISLKREEEGTSYEDLEIQCGTSSKHLRKNYVHFQAPDIAYRLLPSYAKKGKNRVSHGASVATNDKATETTE